jgi:hypothetical protein
VSRLEILLAVWLFVLTTAVAAQIVQIRDAVESLFSIDYNITVALNQTADAVVDLSGAVASNSKDIKSLESRAGALDSEVSYLSSRLEELKKQKGLVNPSYSELVSFVAEDLTDTLVYTDYFTCVDFSNTFVRNFRNKGYYSCVAYVEFEKGAHDFVAVNTTDMGVLYVEPQNDAIIYSLKVGDNYCAKVGWDCNYVIKKLSSCFQ